MHRAQRVAAAAVSAGIAAAIVLTGCSSGSGGGSGDPTTTATSTITDPAALVSAAADNTAALTGAHLNLAVQGKIPNLTAKSVDADLVAQPKTAAEGTATVLLGTTEATAPFVYVDDHLYANIDDHGYLDYGNGSSIYDVSVVLNPDKGLAHLLRSVTAPTAAGTENIDGVTTTKVAGTVPASDLAPLTGVNIAADQNTPVPVTMWITPDNQLARVVLTPAPNASMTISLSKWNETVEVTRPSDITTPTPATPPPSGDVSRDPA
ncbi:LppX_LprAFG lipoprotein [Gordonia desulfuricans]|nr:LppX_LprAFG lipoprotein [Gordonia desulfuricans]